MSGASSEAPAEPDTAATAVETVIGVVGRPARASVTPWGAVLPWADGGAVAPLDWYVAADDRWHVPADEPTLRQRRIDGTPVLETLVRVPGGNAVHRAFAVPDHGGLVVVEVENDSPLPFAVAFTGRPVHTERPPADVPIQGIELPADAVVLPIGHRAIVRVAIALDPDRPGLVPGARLPDRLAGATAVARGWTSTVERASRLVLPDPVLVEALVAARCDLLLDGPVGAGADPEGFVLDAVELVRLGDPADGWLVEIVPVVEALVAAARRRNASEAARAAAAAAVAGARAVAVAAADDRAVADLGRIAARLGTDTSRAAAMTGGEADRPPTIAAGSSRGRVVRRIESGLAAGGALLPAGLPASWLGADFEVHGLPTGPGSSVSYAVRWHGPRPALLWEQVGDAIELSSPAIDPVWRSSARKGEALLAVPPAGRA